MRKPFKSFAILISVLISIVSAQYSPGSGTDGDLNIGSGETYFTDTERTPVTGYNAAGSTTIGVEDGSLFTVGDEILIISMQDPETDMGLNRVGIYETTHILSISGSSLSLNSPLTNEYDATGEIRHQVIKVPNFSYVTIAGTLTCSAWDGTTGGILFFRSLGNVFVEADGIIDTQGKGYRGGSQYGISHGGGQGGESYVGLGGDGGDFSYNNADDGAAGGGAAYAYYHGGNGIAGGGGGSTAGSPGSGSLLRGGSGGGGGGHAGSAGGAGYGTFGYGGGGYANQCYGQNGGDAISGDGCENYTGGGGGGGGTYGSADLAKLYLGSGGGGSGRHEGYTPGVGGAGGGILVIAATEIDNQGLIRAGAGSGNNGSTYSGGGGGGAGGSLYLIADNILNSNDITASGGTGGVGHYGNLGGAGGAGRIRIDTHSLLNSGSISPLQFAGDQAVGIFHMPLEDTPFETGPYTVNASIYDRDGDPITTATLFYSVNGGSFNQLSMTALRDTFYTADIPGQSIGTKIQYYLYAADNETVQDEYYFPNGGAVSPISYMIEGLPPTNFVITDNNDGSAELTWAAPAVTDNLTGYSLYRSQVETFIPDAGNLLLSNSGDLTYPDSGLQDFTEYYYQLFAIYDYSGSADSSAVSNSILLNNTAITTVHGQAFLEGQSNHFNIKVTFDPQSPSAILDSTYTDAVGYYEKVLNAGIYTVILEKEGYQTLNIQTYLSILDDTDLGSGTLAYLGQSNISGDISGIWDGIYTIIGNVTVPAGDSLIIMPGSDIGFLTNSNFFVNGYLEVSGTPEDSVYFHSLPADQNPAPGQWQGIDFNDSSDDNSILQYTSVGYAVDGIACYNSSPVIEHSRFHHNSDMGLELNGDNSNSIITDVETDHNSNHGIYVYEGNPTLESVNSHHNSGYGSYFDTNAYGSATNCIFNHNSGHGMRMVNYSSPTIDNCEVNYNSSWGIRIDYSNPQIGNSEISHNAGSGIRVNNDNNNWCHPLIINSTIEDNLGSGVVFYRFVDYSARISNCTIRNNAGEGIYIYYYCDPQIIGNTILENRSHGISYNNHNENYPTIKNNIIGYNQGDGIIKQNANGSADIQYNTIVGNWGDGLEINGANYTKTIRNNIISENGGLAIRNNVPVQTLEYNDIYQNLGGAYLDVNSLPANSWEFVSVNANGDTADIYLNISEPAGFTLSDSTDYSLLPTSANINAGDPAVSDPDGSVSDIGALYYNLGMPASVNVTGYADQTVVLNWNPLSLDSLDSYNVYYRSAARDDFALYGNTTDTTMIASGLTNNQLYEFAVTGVYPNFESGLSIAVSERPGEPAVQIDPGALNFYQDADTVTQALAITNTGTRDLYLEFLKGQAEGSVRFDGSGDYINMGNHDDHSGMTELTIECWIKRFNSGHFEFVSKHYRHYSLYISSANKFGMYKGYGPDNLYQNWTSDYELPYNEWHHLAVTWSGNTVKYYADGDLVGTFNNAVSLPIPPGNNLQLGRRSDESNHYLNGNLSEVRIWSTALSQEEIQRTMLSTLEGSETGLVGYWPLHEDYNDRTPFNWHGTPYNQTTLTTETAPTLPGLPFVIDETVYQLAPGAAVDVALNFYDTGETGSFVYTTPVLTNSNSEPQIDYEIIVTYGSEIPATPIHFMPVAETGLPYTIVITDAQIDGATMAVGDEVGVYDGDLCVGAGLFDGTFNLPVTTWQEDTGLALEGFTPGDPITFKIFDTSADREATTVASYSIGDGTFAYGQFSALTLDGTVYKIQSVPVTGGLFNLISFNLLPHYANSLLIFDQLDSLEIVYNDEGNAIIPDYNINSIGDINFRDGYHLYSTVDDTIYFEGLSINPLEWGITAEAHRWNSVAFLGESLLDVTLAFPDTLIDSLSIVQTSSGAAWIPSLGVNTIGNLEPGIGYQIALSSDSDINFNYQTNNGMARETLPEPLAVQHFDVTPTGLPYSIVIDDIEVDRYDLRTGDEIAVFDGDLCVGAAVIDESENQLLSAWGSNDAAGIEGYIEGNPMKFKIYIAKYDVLVDAVPTAVDPDNELTFGVGNYSYLSVFGSAPVPEDYTLSQNYPNPFNPVTLINYSVPEDADLSLVIYDISGREVARLVSGFQRSGFYQIRWDGKSDQGLSLASGVYLYRLKSGSFADTKKMLLLK